MVLVLAKRSALLEELPHTQLVARHLPQEDASTQNHGLACRRHPQTVQVSLWGKQAASTLLTILFSHTPQDQISFCRRSKFLDPSLSGFSISFVSAYDAL